MLCFAGCHTFEAKIALLCRAGSRPSRQQRLRDCGTRDVDANAPLGMLEPNGFEALDERLTINHARVDDRFTEFEILRAPSDVFGGEQVVGLEHPCVLARYLASAC